MSEAKEDLDIVAWLMKASQAIYLATDASVADDISPKLKIAASEIKRLREANPKTVYWSGTEEQEHQELQKACDARCKQWGKEDCPRPDHWCSECEHDQAVAMRTTDPAEIAAIERGDL